MTEKVQSDLARTVTSVPSPGDVEGKSSFAQTSPFASMVSQPQPKILSCQFLRKDSRHVARSGVSRMYQFYSTETCMYELFVQELEILERT